MALALVYSPPGITDLLTIGAPNNVRLLLEGIEKLPEEAHLLAQSHHIDVLRELYVVPRRKTMLRMAVTANDFRQAANDSMGPPSKVGLQGSSRAETGGEEEIRELGAEDREIVADLYDSPFTLQGLGERPFYGSFRGGRLAAIAGTHTVSPRSELGTIGGVFTREECRGQGLATKLTSIVAARLIEMGARLLALNVRKDYDPAINAYTKLGFTPYAEFWEGDGILRTG